MYCIGVPLQCRDQLPCFGIPYAACTIMTSSYETVSMFIEGTACKREFMSRKGSKQLKTLISISNIFDYQL